MPIRESGGFVSASMSADTLAAYAEIQRRLLRTTSSRLMERYERGLDEFLRNPTKTGDPVRLANNAYGNAGKVVRSRQSRLTNAERDRADERAATDYIAADFRIFIDQTLVGQRDREVARLLLGGLDAAGIAEAVGISVTSAHVLVSRVRQQNRRAFAKREGGA